MTRFGRPTHGTVVAYLALFFAMSGTAVAAGTALQTGSANIAATTTMLGSRSGVPLHLMAPSGQAPLMVNSTAKVGRLNADLLDGVDGGELQRKTEHTCAGGTAVTSIDQHGRVACAPVDGPAVATAQSRISGACPVGSAVRSVRSDGGVECQVVNGPDPAPQPARHTHKGLRISDLQLDADEAGDWAATARITNETQETLSASLTVTAFRDGKVVGVLHGSVSDLEKGLTNTVEFYSDDDHLAGDVITSFQVDVVF